MLEALLVVVACFARSLPNEGARRSSEKQAITPARYDEGTIATNFNATTTGVRDTITNSGKCFKCRIREPDARVLPADHQTTTRGLPVSSGS